MILNIESIPTRKEAIRFNVNHWKEINKFLFGASWFYNNNKTKIHLKTLEGMMLVSQGDYIVKGIEGEFYPVKAEIFNKSYKILNHDDLATYSSTVAH